MNEDRSLIPSPGKAVIVYNDRDEWSIEDRRRRIRNGCLTALLVILGCICFFIFLALFFPSGKDKDQAAEDQKPAPTQEKVEEDVIPPLPLNPSAGDRYVLKLSGIEYPFRWCPPGEFMMGSPEDEKDLDDPERKHRDDEKQHRVNLTQGFWLLETEVTQEMWKSVMGTSPGKFQGDRNPVEQVSWNDTQEFCSKLTEKLTTLNVTIQLPTEAQWEYACRAGTTGRNYGDPDDIMWYASNSGSKSHPAAQKKPNAWGLHDMQGNVWEWCFDWYDEKFYYESPQNDPNNTNASPVRVLRGCCWNDSAEHCRAAIRYKSTPESHDSNFGFRVRLTENVAPTAGGGNEQPSGEGTGTVTPPPVVTESPKPFQIEPGENAKFEIVSYKLVPPQKRVSPCFFVYTLIGGSVNGKPQSTTYIHNGDLSGTIPKPHKYTVNIHRDPSISYRWDVKKLEGVNDIIVTGASISSLDICNESDRAFGNPFWITLSDGNKIEMKLVKREGNVYSFNLTGYKVLNPKYTYSISFRLRDGFNELFSDTKYGSRSHDSKPMTFTINDQKENYVLDVVCEGDKTRVSHQFYLGDVITRFNNEIRNKPDEKEWTVPFQQGDNEIELKYTRP